jgi:large subunit ribosomal protein L25
MKVKISSRTGKSKGETNTMRRAGNIPAVIYHTGEAGEMICVDGAEFQKAMKNVKPGHLPTTVFFLTGENGKERKAIIKEIQYKPTDYAILHIDFMALVAGNEVSVKIPIELTGTVSCAGVKEGGVIRQVIRHLPVKCDAGKIPEQFTMDVQDLHMKQSKRLSSITIPAGVRPLTDTHEVAVTIAKR